MDEDRKLIEARQRARDALRVFSLEDVVNWNGSKEPIPSINEGYSLKELIPPINENESEADYFARIMVWSEKAKEVPRIHDKWKRHHMNGLRTDDFSQRILTVLEELLKSDFLREDWFDTGIPRKDVEKAEAEIREQGFEQLLEIDGASWKYALLNEFRKRDEKRIVIIERNAGQYINEMYDKLSCEAVEVFCRFVAFIRLVYEEIDYLKSFEKQQQERSEDKGLSAARQSKLDEIIGIMQKGKWKRPATLDNIKLLLDSVFGNDTSLLDDGDVTECEKMWVLIEQGRGDRSVIVPAKLAGFFRSENLIIGGPKAISDDLYGKSNNQVNSINKGKMGCSNDFDAVIPFLKKYIDKIIRQL